LLLLLLVLLLVGQNSLAGAVLIDRPGTLHIDA